MFSHAIGTDKFISHRNNSYRICFGINGQNDIIYQCAFCTHHFRRRIYFAWILSTRTLRIGYLMWQLKRQSIFDYIWCVNDVIVNAIACNLCHRSMKAATQMQLWSNCCSVGYRLVLDDDCTWCNVFTHYYFIWHHMPGGKQQWRVRMH